jgi:sugar phosphate isomerase/epimerase
MDLPAALRLAQQGGFAGLELNAPTVADLLDERGVDDVRALFSEADLRPAGWGLPMNWRGSQDDWQRDLERLPRFAKAAAALGATRCFTWIMPCSNDLPFEQNRAFHIERLTPAARILAEHGCGFGLEFIGPKTLRDSQRYPFVHTMSGMLELGAAIGPNVGLLLDCWHWYTSHGTLADIQALTPEQVVYVHVNDAPKGIAIDEQIDNVRSLPGETGVIDIAGFLGALRGIGYAGPVVPEPFKKELNDLSSDEERVQVVGESMRDIWQTAGLA